MKKKIKKVSKKKAQSSKIRTLREITNLIKRLREMGAISIKIGDVESTFLPKETTQAKEVTDIIKSHIDSSKERVQSLFPPDKEFQKPKEEEDDPDLFDDGLK